MCVCVCTHGRKISVHVDFEFDLERGNFDLEFPCMFTLEI